MKYTDINDYLKKTLTIDKFGYQNCRPRLECNDGFDISVQAGRSLYCEPRENGLPYYSSVELGFPSAEPPDYIMKYCEEPDYPTETVYGGVPVELVDKMLNEHGGIKGPRSAQNE